MTSAYEKSYQNRSTYNSSKDQMRTTKAKYDLFHKLGAQIVQNTDTSQFSCRFSYAHCSSLNRPVFFHSDVVCGVSYAIFESMPVPVLPFIHLLCLQPDNRPTRRQLHTAGFARYQHTTAAIPISWQGRSGGFLGRLVWPLQEVVTNVRDALSGTGTGRFHYSGYQSG